MKLSMLIMAIGAIALLIGYSYITVDFISHDEPLTNKINYYGLSSLNIQTKNEVEKKISVSLSEKGCDYIDTIRTKPIEYKDDHGNIKPFSEGWIVSACNKKYAYSIINDGKKTIDISRAYKIDRWSLTY